MREGGGHLCFAGASPHYLRGKGLQGSPIDGVRAKGERGRPKTDHSKYKSWDKKGAVKLGGSHLWMIPEGAVLRSSSSHQAPVAPQWQFLILYPSSFRRREQLTFPTSLGPAGNEEETWKLRASRAGPWTGKKAVTICLFHILKTDLNWRKENVPQSTLNIRRSSRITSF